MNSGKMESNPIDQVTNDGIIYIIKTLEKASLVHTLAIGWNHTMTNEDINNTYSKW